MISLYVHIPFCEHICYYCDFCKVFYQEKWADDYLDALAFEINAREIPNTLKTIYIGGGTPSSLSYNQLEKLLIILEPYSHNIEEYTIEVNPENMTLEKLDLCLKYWVNRLSIGVQSFDDELLAKIGRNHTSLSAKKLIEEAICKGITNVNVDLMYGFRHQTIEKVIEDIDTIKKLGVQHVSVYSLILERHTQFYNEDYQCLDDEEDAFWHRTIHEKLLEVGYKRYEVSNYCIDKPSLHNLTYWNYEDYIGVGLGAHSLLEHKRIENTLSLNEYLDCSVCQRKTQLNQSDEFFEYIMMGLRLCRGVSIDNIKNRFNIDIEKEYADIILKYESLKMLEIVDGSLRTTMLGMNYLNTILVDFLE